MPASEGIPQIVFPGEYKLLKEAELPGAPTGQPIGISKPPGRSPGKFGGPIGTDDVTAAIRAHELGKLGVFHQILAPGPFLTGSPDTNVLLGPVAQAAVDLLVNHRWPGLM